MTRHTIHNLGFELAGFQDVTTLVLRADAPVPRTITVNREKKGARSLQDYVNSFRAEFVRARLPALKIGPFAQRKVGSYPALAAVYTHELPADSPRGSEPVDRHFVVVDVDTYFYSITYTCPAGHDARELESVLTSCTWK